ncbi:amino acid adenylation domain-containing protein [Paenibacillus phyllosphaerae]|uniref:Amino acid adenylation domain-containing protein n=1 Tax=Paenibacillus phyllosphaerae TaxID=274593 RepID=A0A7W5B298_9BACL|nr:non-ribosomal peptide synthetase [Paenibacillus phyllosphaerae]MBB3113018.1 amino acid adenylation domain-containing protein [Paenibacillus phyllosphaerae]
MNQSTVSSDDYNAVHQMYPLSPMQEAMVYSAWSGMDNKAYFVQYAYRGEGELDPALLRESVRELARRHDILRTQIIYERVTRPLQVVTNESNAECVYEDLTAMTDEEQVAYIDSMKRRDRERGFLPSDSILMRIRVFRQQSSRFTLLWSFHHILMDAWCVPMISQELLHIYAALKSGRHPAQRQPQPYSRYIHWLERRSKQQSFDYWERLLEGYDQIAALPIRWREAKEQTGKDNYRQQDLIFQLDRFTTERLHDVARANGVTLNTLFQAMWGILLQRYNNTNDVVFGAVVSGRPPEVEGVEEMVGLFINTIPVRIQASDKVRIGELLRNVQERMSASLGHSYLPLFELAAKFSANTGSRKLLDHLFLFENYPVLADSQDFGTDDLGFLLQMEEEFEQADFDFNIIVVPGEEMRIVYRFNANEYEPAMIERMKEHLLAIATQIADKPDMSVGEIDLLTSADRELLRDFDRIDQAEQPTGRLMDGFAAQAALHPHQTAVICGEREVSYGELSRWAGYIAEELRRRQVGPNDKVACYMGRTPLLLAALLGIWQAGAAYVPLDPDYPAERIRYMFQDSGAKLVLTDAANASQLPTDATPLLAGEIIDASGAEAEPSLDGHNVRQEQAYIIYTSGSTGQPKGVMVGADNVQYFFAGVSERIPFPANSRVLSAASVSFDIFVLEALLPLWKGLTVVLADDQEAARPDLLNGLLARHGVNVFQTTPSRLQRMLLADEASESFAALDMLLVGGESISVELLQSFKSVSSASVFNMYGPTETTVWATAAEISGEGRIKIGLPFNGVSIAIVNPDGREQPVGITGEIVIGGPVVTQGYCNLPDLTASRFCALPGRTANKWYRTGDIGVVMPDGSLIYAGRMDHQIKFLGHRIELGEIEACLAAYPGIRRVCVLHQVSANGQPFLRAFIETTDPRVIDALPLFAADRLLRHMLPGDWVRVEQFPLTPSGKLDRRALAEIPMKATASEADNPGIDLQLVDQLKALWQKVLDTQDVGLKDSFFELGGSSIHAAKVEIILESMGFSTEPLLLYRYETIEKLAKYLNALSTV